MLSLNFPNRHIKALLTATLTVITIAATVTLKPQSANQPTTQPDAIEPIRLEMIRKALIASRGLL